MTLATKKESVDMEKFMIRTKNGNKVEFFGPYDTEDKAKAQAKTLDELGVRKVQEVQVIFTCSTVTDLVREARQEAASSEEKETATTDAA